MRTSETQFPGAHNALTILASFVSITLREKTIFVLNKSSIVTKNSFIYEYDYLHSTYFLMYCMHVLLTAIIEKISSKV